jgi:glutamine amidotransferase
LTNPKIGIVEYGAGNLKSLINALQRLKKTSISVVSSPDDLMKIDAIILPGVGAFAMCMDNLSKSGLITALNRQVLEKSIPILGICLGMQLFAENSVENGDRAGLGWIPGKVTRMKTPKGLPLPHVGWNQVTVMKKEGLFSNSCQNPDFYFDHSYVVNCEPDVVAGKTLYGISVVSSIQHKNIYGVQFHPEISGERGLKLLDNFVQLA